MIQPSLLTLYKNSHPFNNYLFKYFMIPTILTRVFYQTTTFRKITCKVQNLIQIKSSFYYRRKFATFDAVSGLEHSFSTSLVGGLWRSRWHEAKWTRLSSSWRGSLVLISSGPACPTAGEAQFRSCTESCTARRDIPASPSFLKHPLLLGPEEIPGQRSLGPPTVVPDGC